MALILMFLLGMCFMYVCVGIYGGYLVTKEKDGKKAVRDAIKDIELIGSIKYRFTKVSEITDRQMQLISSTERPSASAAHSRHKNSIVGELKALEQEKIEIFKSILADGVDPQLSIVIDGQQQNIKMSEAVAIFEGGGHSQIPPTKPATESTKLHIVKDTDPK